jgi:transcriptional regulator with XRE-family HTH domain
LSSGFVDFSQLFLHFAYYDRVMALIFWERMNKLIKEQGITQESLAKRTGIKFQTLRSWLTKDTLPRVDDAHKIAGELGVTVEFLLEGRNSEVSQEEDKFYMRFRRFSVMLDYMEELSPEQREDIEAFVVTLFEKKAALMARATRTIA